MNVTIDDVDNQKLYLLYWIVRGTDRRLCVSEGWAGMFRVRRT